MRMLIYRDAIFRLLSIFGSLCSLAALLYSLAPKEVELSFSFTGGVFAALLTVLVIIMIVLEFKSNKNKYITRAGNTKKINKYLYNWIKAGGRVAIFSRDLSWTDDSSVQELLVNKSKDAEVSIFVPEKNERVDKLKKEGANIYMYGECNTIPQSRFTIIDFQRMGARVAVGMRVGKHHIIEEYNSNDHPAFHMAHDLVNLIMNCEKARESSDKDHG